MRQRGRARHGTGGCTSAIGPGRQWPNGQRLWCMVPEPWLSQLRIPLRGCPHAGSKAYRMALLHEGGQPLLRDREGPAWAVRCRVRWPRTLRRLRRRRRGGPGGGPPGRSNNNNDLIMIMTMTMTMTMITGSVWCKPRVGKSAATDRTAGGARTGALRCIMKSGGPRGRGPMGRPSFHLADTGTATHQLAGPIGRRPWPLTFGRCLMATD